MRTLRFFLKSRYEKYWHILQKPRSTLVRTLLILVLNCFSLTVRQMSATKRSWVTIYNIRISIRLSNMDQLLLQTTFCQYKFIMPSSFNRAKHMSYKPNIGVSTDLEKGLNEQVKLIKVYSIYLHNI